MSRVTAILLGLLVPLALLSLLVGAAPIPLSSIGDMIHRPPTLGGLILLDIRLPRLLLGLLVGGILGLAGGVLQGLLRNPLADPGLLGVSGGASLGAVIAIYYGAAAGFALATPLFALAGAGLTAGIVLPLARGGGTLTLILSGAAVASLAGAGVSLALNLAPNPYAAYEIMSWLMGSLTDRSWDQLALEASFIIAGGLMLSLTAPALERLALGEVQAESLGINLRRVRLLALGGTALGVGAATAAAGAIGFVGLVAPHLVRTWVGHRPGRVLLPATLAGAAIVTAADLATRVVRPDVEIRLGVFVALVGAPAFLVLIRRTARGDA